MTTLVLLTALTAAGAPAAVFLLGRGAWTLVLGWSTALGLGIAVTMTATMALTRLGVFSRASFVAVLAMWTIGTTAALVATRTRRELLPTADRTDGILAGLAIATLAVRVNPSYFLFETGDMGEYVNRANQLADGGGLVGSFPHGFTFLLASAHQLVGEASMVQLLPALGVAITLGAAALARLLGAAPWAVVAVTALGVVHPSMTWYSQFPVSEMLAAAMLVSGLAMLVAARRDGRTDAAAAAGVLIGLLVLVRITGLVWLTVAPASFLLSYAVDDLPRRRAQAAFAGACLSAGLLAMAYNVRYLPTYFVDQQLLDMLPGQLSRVLSQLGFFDWPNVLGPVASIIFGSTVLFTAAARHRGTSRLRDQEALITRVGGFTLIAATCLVLVVAGTDGLVDALVRWGWILLAFGGVGLWSLFTSDRIGAVVAFLVATPTSTSLVLFASRFPEARRHAYYLYWDRYLLDTVLPLAFVLAALGLSAFTRSIASWSPAPRAALLAGAAALAGWMMVPLITESAAVSSRPFLGEPYRVLDEVSSTLAVESEMPVVFTAPEGPPPVWFYPNYYRAFGLPLAETFGHRVIGLPAGGRPDGPDPNYTLAEATELIREAGGQRGAVVRVRPAGASPAEWDPQPPVRSVSALVWLRFRELDPADERFIAADLVLDVYLVELDEGSTS